MNATLVESRKNNPYENSTKHATSTMANFVFVRAGPLLGSGGGFDLNEQLGECQARDTEKRHGGMAACWAESTGKLVPGCQYPVHIRRIHREAHNVGEGESSLAQNGLDIVERLTHLVTHIARMQRATLSVHSSLTCAYEPTLWIAHFVGLHESELILPRPWVNDLSFQPECPSRLGSPCTGDAAFFQLTPSSPVSQGTVRHHERVLVTAW